MKLNLTYTTYQRYLSWLLAVFLLTTVAATAQPVHHHWSEQSRKMRYTPDHNDFVIVNGEKRFNRALYGTNTGFRIEAGDLPEFGLYMTRLGGTLRLGLVKGEQSKWLIDANIIETRYNNGAIHYRITDDLLENGQLKLHLLALADADGLILKVEGEKVPADVRLFWTFGGASDKRFSREGDLGADPESVFYLKAENCLGNEYIVDQNSFRLYYKAQKKFDPTPDSKAYELAPEERQDTLYRYKKSIFGIFPPTSNLALVDAANQESPRAMQQNAAQDAPVASGEIHLNTSEQYLLLANPRTSGPLTYNDLPRQFTAALEAREAIAAHFKIHTPDEYVNAAGSALAAAADGVWDGKAFMHGAVAWRMPLNGWRGAYAADWLGWPERAKTHFRGYFKAQYTEPVSGPSVPDPKTHLARQKEEVGTSMFTDGYISRNPGKISKPHHYDMNLVFISQLLWHYQWTGDTAFIKESWPVLERHLAWEQRNYDANDDGLYDAYCCIWASDALQYSGGGVTHSSAYNYRANRVAAELAPIVGKDPAPYLAEAEKIKKAVNEQLWLPGKGWFAEYKDLLRLQRVHPSSAVWTSYHAIDEGLADPFQAWQSTQYIDNEIPQIPVVGEGVPSGNFYTISTTNWMPYTWSINNVALAEVLHTALAYWQSGRSDEAFQLTKSSFLDYMFMGSCPGNYGQLSYYDAFRGELYRDFSDPVGVASRVFVEGLFGFTPQLLNNEIQLKPGWPNDWNYAQLETPYLKLDFEKEDNTDYYNIQNKFGKALKLQLSIPTNQYLPQSVLVNGEETNWTYEETAIGQPVLLIQCPEAETFEIELKWSTEQVDSLTAANSFAQGDVLNLSTHRAEILAVYDPQQVLGTNKQKKNSLKAEVTGELGHRSFFVQLQQDGATWWQPVAFELRAPIEFSEAQEQDDRIELTVINNSSAEIEGTATLNGWKQAISTSPVTPLAVVSMPKSDLKPGTNSIRLQNKRGSYHGTLTNWNVRGTGQYETIDLASYFNDAVTNIFTEQYLSPRSPYPTLSLPIQGIGDWCSYREHEEIDDSGIRAKMKEQGKLLSPQGIPFITASTAKNNILFTSQWDVYPESASIPLAGKASHAYLLMAGSVHHMNINILNGLVEVAYADGTSDVLELKSPDNWWPIEQDYYEDGYAFQLKGPRPPRLHLQTGEWTMEGYPILEKNKTNKIEGGAATLLDLPLNPNKELKTIRLKTLSNDLVIGLMAVTLERN